MKTGDLKQTVARLFASFAGQGNVLTIPRPFLALTGNDHHAALLLSQCVYWSDRTSDPEGWVAKSYVEWLDELGMTEYQVRRAAKALARVGLETKLKKWAGAPTLHYRINRIRFSESILEFLQNGNLSFSRINPEVSQESLTETTAETTAETTSLSAVADELKDSASAEKASRPRSETQKARDRVWESVKVLFGLQTAAPALIGRYTALITGTAQEYTQRGKKRVHNGEWFEYQVIPGMTGDEVDAFAEYVGNHEITLASPERINHWSSRFRASDEYAGLVARAARKWRLAQSPQSEQPQQNDPTTESDDMANPDDVAAIWNRLMQHTGRQLRSAQP